MRQTLIFSSIFLALGACAEAGDKREAASASTLEIVQVLAGDDMQGRLVGSQGGAKARAFLENELKLRGLAPAGEGYAQAFTFENRKGEPVNGVNLVALIPGRGETERVMAVTAHYDHVGMREGEIYNGADDNASGVAGALAIADHFLANPPEHDVIIALLDAEEAGLNGAKALIKEKNASPERVALNLNLDMLSKNDKNELYVAGAYHTPALRPVLEEIGADASVVLKLGHDSPEYGDGDWTLQSDHAVYHRAGVPFVYFGVEDHPDYHQPSDDYSTIPQDFFLRSVETVVMAADRLDEQLASVAPAAAAR